MAADLHIHVMENCSEEDVAHFFGHTMGSKHFALGSRQNCYSNGCYDNGPCSRVQESPNVWVGEVSWLKAALSGDTETFIPEPVAQVHEIIGEDLPELTPDLRFRILKALNAGNTTSYSIESDQKVIEFLDKHIGKRLFTVSW